MKLSEHEARQALATVDQQAESLAFIMKVLLSSESDASKLEVIGAVVGLGGDDTVQTSLST